MRLKHLLLTLALSAAALAGLTTPVAAQIFDSLPDSRSGGKLLLTGGVSSIEDILAAKAIGCDGAIVGRALYENRFTLPDAIATAA